MWEPPGGAIDPGESAAEAAARELGEEAGIVAPIEPDRSIALHRDYVWKGESRTRDEQIFLVWVTHADVRGAMEASEAATFIEWRWLTEHQVRGLNDDEIYPADPFALARTLGA